MIWMILISSRIYIYNNNTLYITIETISHVYNIDLWIYIFLYCICQIPVKCYRYHYMYGFSTCVFGTFYMVITRTCHFSCPFSEGLVWNVMPYFNISLCQLMLWRNYFMSILVYRKFSALVPITFILYIPKWYTYSYT